MTNAYFAQLMDSVIQADQILQGKRALLGELRVSSLHVRYIRNASRVSQRKVSRIINVYVAHCEAGNGVTGGLDAHPPRCNHEQTRIFPLRTD